MIKYSEYEQESIRVALLAIEQTLANNDSMQSTREVESYLKIKLASQPDEWFAVLFLTIQHRLIPSQRLFRGTVNSSHSHARVIVRKALEVNSTAIILAHITQAA